MPCPAFALPGGTRRWALVLAATVSTGCWSDDIPLAPGSDGGVGDLPAARATVGPLQGRILFTSVREGTDGSAIFVMNADGSDVTLLSDGPGTDRHGRWSPNGQRIAFSSERADDDEEIYVMNRDGSEVTRLTYHPGLDFGPDWSPNGRKIAFASRREGNVDVYVMNADGSGLMRLTSAPSGDVWPSWSPNGRKILFQSHRDGNSEVYIMNPDGTGETNLTRNSASDNIGDAWAPNGRTVAFYSQRDTGGPTSEIYLMNPDGGDVRRLGVQGGVPAWSPDGRKIAFARLQPGAVQIFVMRADGSAITQITEGPGAPISPHWGRRPLAR